MSASWDESKRYQERKRSTWKLRFWVRYFRLKWKILGKV